MGEIKISNSGKVVTKDQLTVEIFNDILISLYTISRGNKPKDHVINRIAGNITILDELVNPVKIEQAEETE